MIVLDASALVELLLGTDQGRSIAARIADPGLGFLTSRISLTWRLRRR